MSTNEEMRSRESQRGYTVDDVWYHYSSEQEDSEGRRGIDCVHAVEDARGAFEDALYVLSELSSLLHVVRVSSVVQEDVLRLCHDCVAVTADISLTRDVCSGLARAAARREARAAHKDRL